MAADRGRRFAHTRPKKTKTETQGVKQAAALLFQHLRDHHDPADGTADLPPPRLFIHADPYLLASLSLGIPFSFAKPERAGP